MSLKNICHTFDNIVTFFKARRPFWKASSDKINPLPVASVGASLNNYNPFYEGVTKSNKYWIHQNIEEVLVVADDLFKHEQYLEVYEILNRIKYEKNAEVQWRISRALFKMSCNATLTTNIRSQMIFEAFDLINNALLLEPNNAQAHKWMAILTDARASLEGTNARVKSYETVKKHLIKSSQLNPNDASVFYMLGKLCFDMSDFSWWQRKFISFLFIAPPVSTYEEAFDYFLKAEKLTPRFYLPNLYLLGRASYHLKQMFRARFYLKEAAQMVPRNAYEKLCCEEAQKLARKLSDYDLAKEVMNDEVFELDTI